MAVELAKWLNEKLQDPSLSERDQDFLTRRLQETQDFLGEEAKLAVNSTSPVEQGLYEKLPPVQASGQVVFDRAIIEARHFNHNYVGTEHLLLGATHEPVTRFVLESMGVTRTHVSHYTQYLIGFGDPQGPPAEINLTPRSQKAKDLAGKIAKDSGSSEVGSTHILLGLIDEGEGIAVSCMESLGVNLDQLRRRTVIASSFLEVDIQALKTYYDANTLVPELAQATRTLQRLDQRLRGNLFTSTQFNDQSSGV